MVGPLRSGARRGIDGEHDSLDSSASSDEDWARRVVDDLRRDRPDKQPPDSAQASRPYDDEVGTETAGLDDDLRRRPTLENTDVHGPITDPEAIGDLHETT